MKNAPPGTGAARDADEPGLLAGSLATFRVTAYSSVAYGSKRAEFTVDIDGVGTFLADYFVPADRPAFVAFRSIRSKYSGKYERTGRFANELAAELCEVIEARLSADESSA